MVELAAEFVVILEGAGRDGLVQGGELLGVGERGKRGAVAAHLGFGTGSGDLAAEYRLVEDEPAHEQRGGCAVRTVVSSAGTAVQDAIG